jgi:hypothetical protein
MRQRYVATQLLQTLKTHPLFNDVTVVELVSSHPAACDVLAKYAGDYSICHDVCLSIANKPSIARHQSIID